MDRQLFRYTLLSIRRRLGAVARTCVAAFLAVFFVTAVLLFEENMFEWQVASNKDRFGDWFIMEANVGRQSEYFMNHPKLAGCGEAVSAVKLFDENYDPIDCRIGYMSPEFLEIGCIQTIQGRLPEADNEVAMDARTLAKLGITDPELGQTLTLRYYEDNEEYDNALRRTAEFVLVGVLENYTNVWNGGGNLPGALVTKERFETFDYEGMNAYIYKLVESERHGDHEAVYQEILSGTKLQPRYNGYVYDFEAWGTESVYTYMYVLVMVIGIAALTYQLLVYKNSRNRTYELMRRLGATKGQIRATALVENVLMLLPSGLAGIGMAALTGKLVCAVIEAKMGISFYYINLEILAKGLLAIVVAVVVEEIIGRVVSLSRVFVPAEARKLKVEKCELPRKELSCSNTFWTISTRFIKANTLGQNVSIRIFALVVCVVIVLCTVKIYDAHTVYDANKDNIDFIGVSYVDNEYTMKVPYYAYTANIEEFWEEANEVYHGNVDISEVEAKPTAEQIQEFIQKGRVSYLYNEIEVDDKRLMLQLYMAICNGRFYRAPDVNVTAGLTEEDIDVIKNVVGVDSVTFSTYESQRAWTWDSMSLEKMGYSALMQDKIAGVASPSEYSGRYLFATEYVEPTKEMYERLSKYMESDMVDYEAFCKGEQVLVIQDSNPYDEYDDTMTAGTTINYHYYELPTERYSYQTEAERSAKAVFGFDKEYMDYTQGKLWEYTQWSVGGTVNVCVDNYDDYNRIINETRLVPCVQTKVAAVVTLTDEVKKEFGDLIARFGYYTAIGSNTLAEKACEQQNKMLEKLAGLAGITELPEECKAKVVYNQVYVKYNLQASVCATDNILSTYSQENGIDYVSFSEVNEAYRTNLINAWLQYGITIVAVVVINMLIGAVVARNKIESRKQRVELLLRLGAERKDIRKVFVIEAIRESLWCVFTVPLILLIRYVIYRRYI